MNITKNTQSYFGGTMMIAGTAIGAGMLALPVVMAGAWLWWALIVMLVTWLCMFLSGLMILETNLNYHIGASFHTMVKDLLGQPINIINGLSIAFVLYILDYAYVSAIGGAVTHAFTSINFNIDKTSASLICASLVALVVWFGSTTVNRITTIVMSAKIIAFVLALASFYSKTEPQILFNLQDTNPKYLPFVFATLPFCLASFGYHGNVPSLMKHFGKDHKTIIKSIFYGTLIALIIYASWIVAVMGIVPRESFKQIIANGGNLDAILAMINFSGQSKWLNFLLTFFANFSILSSFIGVSLGLFDYVADMLKLENTKNGRSQTLVLTFAPPMVLGVLFPDGFIYAIGFAGLAATIWAVIVPALLAQASRRKFPNQSFTVTGGNWTILLVIIFGLANIAAYISSTLDILPSFK